VVAATQPKLDDATRPRQEVEEWRLKRQGQPFPFGWREDLTKYVVRQELKRPGVVALHGPNGTRKSTIAVNFLIDGLVGRIEKADNWVSESGVLIRLKDVAETQELSEIQVYPQMNRVDASRLGRCPDGSAVQKIKNIVPETKGELRVWAVDKDSNKEVIVEVDFHTGMLFAEEFVDVVRNVCRVLEELRKNIGRLVIDDVSGIGGGSYPLLER